MPHALTLHPDSRCDAAAGIEVEVVRPRAGHPVLHYIVTGKIGDLVLPPASEPARKDGLWRHTCFEAFLRPLPGEAYCEFNVAPSNEWAAYRFDGYRSGMRDATGIASPRIETQSGGARFDLRVSLELDLPGNAPWRLGLAAAIEEVNGRLSYWALAHPPGKPDFHHPDCFALELPGTSPP